MAEDSNGTVFAHTVEGRPTRDWQPLREHLDGVAALAERFCASFGAERWGRLAGLWHDLGKYRQAFQDYLAGRRDGAQHSVVGALHARDRTDAPLDLGGLALALVIAGHHGGLPNWSAADRRRPLEDRLREERKLLAETLPEVPGDLRDLALPALPERFRGTPDSQPAAVQDLRRSFELWVRFLYSALVDADSLDTAEFLRPGERARDTAGFDHVSTLRARLDAYVDQKAEKARRSAASDLARRVNQLRADVLAACRAAADELPGLRTLTVPTGGGKTLAAMAFALRHAERHGLRRVIAVIPLTSIIDQNAAVYRDALGERQVIEHHSNLDPAKETRRNRLASENWDAPVIVTTAVQFFESLFANRRSRCRKLHNVARSVILIDEAQTLPTGFQMPILEALHELREKYGCSVVLSTATQPAFEHHPEEFDHGLKGLEEIAPDPRELARRVRRFRVEWPDPQGEPVEWPDLAAKLAGEKQVLAIVHQRRDARRLAELLPPQGRFHLSALMCPAHRSQILAQVNDALNGGTCRLVSTQLIEAGVDVDFPVVYRALGGLDSLTQAGGRCNREGALDSGRLVVFRAPSEPPTGTLRKGLDSMIVLLGIHGEGIDLTDPAHAEDYFRMLFAKERVDVKGIQAERQRLSFATVGEKFRLIEDYTEPVVVPWDGAGERLDRFRADGPSRERLRALQPFLVNVRRWHLERLREAGAVELVHDAIYALHPAYAKLYDPNFGLTLEGEIFADPQALIV